MLGSSQSTPSTHRTTQLERQKALRKQSQEHEKETKNLNGKLRRLECVSPMFIPACALSFVECLGDNYYPNVFHVFRSFEGYSHVSLISPLCQTCPFNSQMHTHTHTETHTHRERHTHTHTHTHTERERHTHTHTHTHTERERERERDTHRERDRHTQRERPPR